MQNNYNSPGPTPNSANYQTSGSDKHKKLKKAILGVSGLLTVLLVILGIQLVINRSETELRLKEIICTLADGTSFTYSKTDYREDGQKKGSESYFSDGSIQNQCTYTYDGKGLLTEVKDITFHENTGTVKWEKTLCHETAGSEFPSYSVLKCFNEAGKLDYSYLTRYNPDGIEQAEHCEFYDDEGLLRSTLDYEYDQYGEKVRYCYQSYNAGIIGDYASEEIFQNQYDSHGNLICSERINFIVNQEESGGLHKELREYVYDAEGRILSEVDTIHSAEYSSKTEVIKYFYKYDERGNQIEYQFVPDPQYTYENGYKIRKTLCTYAQDGRLLTREDYENNTLTARYDYVYE